jgi:NAD(P)-dependent dehydrogenase (short-subunit alcohol dehydrogenase family)
MTDKVVIITGGSRGIGRATAIAAAARGYRVVVGYASNQAAAAEVVAAIESKNGKAIAVKCDVASEEDILALFKAADTFGTLGALVNNAGIVGTTSRVDEMSAERIQRMMAVNVTCRRSLPSSARPTPTSTTRRRRAPSIPSLSGWATRSRARAFASPRSVRA